MIEYRPLQAEELPLLEEFLYLSIFQPDQSRLLPRGITQEPQLAAYIENWGRRGDHCIVAVRAKETTAVHLADDGPAGNVPRRADRSDSAFEVVGAAWSRILAGDPPGYGNVDAKTPELAISVKPEWRGRGIGTQLMHQLLGTLRAAGFSRASLSVQQANPALKLYQRLGFITHTHREDDLVMAIELYEKQL